jgi:predicted TIM-barrel fold metal-dependent hydrolase
MTAPAAAGDAPIIDCHAHIMVARMPFAAGAWTRPDYDYAVEAYLADLDAHGIAFGVVTAASLYGDYNDYTLDALAGHKRLRATAMAGPATDRDALAALARQGVTGLRLQWSVKAQLPDLRDHGWRKLFNRLADLGMHAELNVSGAQMAQILPAITQTGVKVMIDHFGLLRSPEGLQGEGFTAILRAVAQGSTWVKLSAGFRIEPALLQPAADALLREAGPERLVWGSDAPFVRWEDKVTYASTVELFRRLVPDVAVRRLISDTGLRFYFF